MAPMTAPLGLLIPSTRRPVSVKGDFSFLNSVLHDCSILYLCEHRRGPVAILPSALLMGGLRPVQVGRSRFSGCCDLLIALLVSRCEPGAGINPQSPSLGDVLSFAFFQPQRNFG